MEQVQTENIIKKKKKLRKEAPFKTSPAFTKVNEGDPGN